MIIERIKKLKKNFKLKKDIKNKDEEKSPR